MQCIVRWIAAVIATAVSVFLIPGVTTVGGESAWIALAIFGLILALADMVVKPILKVLTLPITVLTLGIFYLFINAIVLIIASNISISLFGCGVQFSSLFTAFLASIVISIVEAIISGVIGTN